MLPLLLALAATPPSPAPAAPAEPQACVAKMSESELDTLVKKLHDMKPMGERVEAASGAFLKTPYVLDPLGEGPGAKPDADPVVRFDAVDCVTYVEEALALAESPDLDSAKSLLQKIRYRGDTIAYTERNHFMESDWIPNNVKKGFLKDITAQVGGADTQHDVRTVTMEQWRARTDATTLALPDDRAPIGHFDLAYIPLELVEKHAKDIPNGVVLAVAHKSDEKTTNRYSHVAFVVRRGDAVFVRHASSLKHEVIEDTLADFVEKNRKYKQWPVSGFVFLQVLDASPKVVTAKGKTPASRAIRPVSATSPH